MPGETSLVDALTKFSPIVYTSSSNDSRNTSGLLAITLKEEMLSVLS